MSFEERNAVIGLVLGAVFFATYWVVVIARAAGDSAPFTEVAWQGPLLLVMIVGGSIYGIGYAVARWRARGTRTTDERDIEILARAESVGSGLGSLAASAALIMLALDASTFWTAHVLFVGMFLASVASSGFAISAYRDGVVR